MKQPNPNFNSAHPSSKKEYDLPSFFPGYLTTFQAASYLGVSHQYLEIGRCKGDGPPFIKLSRLVRYKKSDLDQWMESRKQLNTIGSQND